MCTHCRTRVAFEKDHIPVYQDGEAPACLACKTATELRQAQGRRALTVGALRPDILLYNQVHAESDNIAALMNRDIASNPDMLIVMGTSLKIPGVKV
jgi:NAD-dependent histone deacetylase SIR2